MVDLVSAYPQLSSLGLWSGQQGGSGFWAFLNAVGTAAVCWLWLGGGVAAWKWAWEDIGLGHCGEKQ